MHNSDSRRGDMQNCGSVIADCRSQAGHIPHLYNLLSVVQDIFEKYLLFATSFLLRLVPDALFLIAFIDKVGGVGKVE